MSDEFDVNDDEDDTETTAPKGNTPKDLRAALAKANKRAETAEAEAAELKKAHRKVTVAAELEKFGAKPSLAKYVDTDNVEEWLKENGEDFGWSPVADEDDDDEDIEEVRRISRASTLAKSTAKLPALTPEYIRSASHEELVARGVLPAF